MINEKHTYIICTSPMGNAASNYFFMLAESLFEDGNKVILVVDKRPNKISNHKGIKVYSWPSNRPQRAKDFIFFYQLCKTYKPDVTFSQFGSTNIVSTISKLIGIKNRWVYWHTMIGQLNADTKIKGYKLSLLHFRKKWVLKLFASHIFTNSNATKADLINAYKIQTIPISVLYLLIDDYFDGKIINEKEKREFAIAFIGRMQNSKGHKEVLEALPQILEQYPLLKVYFIGNGPKRNFLEQRCQDLNIGNNVHFTRDITLDAVYNYLSKVLIHVSASHEEAFGLVNIEALSAGTPLIANNVGGIKDILINGKNGYFCNGDNYKLELLKNIKLILEGDWETMSKKARLDFIERFKLHDVSIQKQVKLLYTKLK